MLLHIYDRKLAILLVKCQISFSEMGPLLTLKVTDIILHYILHYRMMNYLISGFKDNVNKNSNYIPGI